LKDDASNKASELSRRASLKKDEMVDKTEDVTARAKSSMKSNGDDLTERLREKAEELRALHSSQSHEQWSIKSQTQSSTPVSASYDKSESGSTYVLNEPADVTSERAPSLGGFQGLRNELGGEGDGIRLAAMSQDFSEL